MIIGFLFSLLAGMAIGLQGVFNTRLSEKVGLWETTAIVHFIGLIFALTLVFFLGEGSFKKALEVKKIYLLGGVFGVIIIYSIIKGISLLGTSVTISVVIISQLLIATLIDSFGLFGMPQIKFEVSKVVGLLVMIAGMFIFKSKG